MTTIKLNVNNNQTIEIEQKFEDSTIYVNKTDNKGNVDSFTITPEDMTMLLNYYQFQKDHGKEIF